MLIVVFTTVVLCTLAICAVAKATQVVLRRFDLDLLDALLWLGLAERPAGSQPPRRWNVDRPARARRHSPHRALLRTATRRRPAAPGSA